MAVFFSGTDSSELVDNSEFHNYYVSLIVNNRNEMVAKVAFRGEEIKEIKSVVTYRGSDGDLRTKEATGTSKEACVYTYDCNIVLPELVGESFEARFLQIKEDSEKKAKELAKKAKEISESRSTTEKAYGGFDVDRRWSENDLFGAPNNEGRKGKGGKSKKRNTDWLDDDKPVIVGVPDYNARRKDKEAKWDKKSMAGMKTNVYNFLIKWLTQNFTADGRLSEVLSDLEKVFVLGGSDLTMYCDRLERTITSYYVDTFQEDFHMNGFESCLEASTSYLEAFSETYPELVANITEVLNICSK